jgi:CBS domain-containing protein
MQRDPIAVSAQTPLADVHRLFLAEEIHGAPVIDDDGTVLGVLSSMDLIRATLDGHEPDGAPPVSAYFRDDVARDRAPAPSDLADHLVHVTAVDVASPEIVRVGPDTPIADVARIMREQRIHRVLVAEDGVLLGILTTFDLLRLVENGRHADELELEHRVH